MILGVVDLCSIACAANVANLVNGQAASRSREMALLVFFRLGQ